MQTNIGINAKGNIVKNEIDITNNVVTNGDGLYIDEYEEGRYVYKGANPNNYIEFNNELWRIISKEADETYKIIRNEVLENMAFSSEKNCSTAYNYILKKYDTYIIDNFIYLAGWGDTSPACNNWAEPVELNIYLNEKYYNNLNLITQSQIQSHIWYIGGVTKNNTDLVAQINDEKSSQWTGNVGLITASDYIRANNNNNQCENYQLQNDNYTTCQSTNWLYLPNKPFWTISPDAANTNSVYASNLVNSHKANSDVISPRPVVYISSEIKIRSGTGTESDPYQIEL